MGLLGYFFKLSYVMKDYHKILTEDYKFSTWVSYAFFTAATILVGGLLGLVSSLNYYFNSKVWDAALLDEDGALRGLSQST